MPRQRRKTEGMRFGRRATGDEAGVGRDMGRRRRTGRKGKGRWTGYEVEVDERNVTQGGGKREGSKRKEEGWRERRRRKRGWEEGIAEDKIGEECETGEEGLEGEEGARCLASPEPCARVVLIS